METWKKLSFGAVIATVVSVGVLIFDTDNRPQSSGVSSLDTAAIVERYLFCRAIVGEWPFTTNAVTNVAWGVGDNYTPTNLPAGIASWSFYPWTNRVPVFGIHVPVSKIYGGIMQDLPNLCTNFVREVGTNTDGSLLIHYWDQTSLWAYAHIGDGTSLWTVARGTNGLPVYSNTPAVSVPTCLVWEVWRVLTNLNQTVRPVVSITNTEAIAYARSDAMEYENIGRWPDTVYTNLYSYPDFSQYAYSTETNLPSPILIENGILPFMFTNEAMYWKFSNIFETGQATNVFELEIPETVAGSSYKNKNTVRRYYYRRYVVPFYYSSFLPKGTYEALYTSYSPLEYFTLKTNHYEMAVACFPSGVTVQASIISSAILNWTNYSDSLGDRSILGRYHVSTSEPVSVSFAGDLSTGVFSVLSLSLAPDLRSVITGAVAELYEEPVPIDLSPFANPGSEPKGWLDENEYAIWATYAQENARLQGTFFSSTNGPLALLKWNFTQEYR